MAIVGTAEVIITAVTTKLQEGIKSGLDDAARDAEGHGQVLGDNFGTGMEQGAKGHFAGLVEQMGMGLASGGEAEGEKFGHNVSQGISHGLGTNEHDFDSIARAAENAGRDAGSAIDSGVQSGLTDAENAAGGAGDDMGNAISDGIKSAGNFGDWMGILKIGGLVAALGLAGAAIANVVAGLFAMVAAAAPAAAALAAFLPIAGGLAFTLGTLALGFMGVFKAVSALNKQQGQAGQSAQQQAAAEQAAADRVISAREAVAHAIQALDSARQSAADDAVSAAHAESDAEYNLQQAHLAELQAQKDLIAARQQAAEQLIQLDFQARQSVISEREASLALADAQLKFEETMADPRSTARAKEDARLALEQAKLNLDEASQRRLDAKKADQAADKKGVEGSDAVVAAKKRENDAHHQVIESEYTLARLRHSDAEQAVRDQQNIQNAIQSVTDAQRGLREALQAQAQAQNGVAGATSATTNALKNLSPEAIKFAKYLVSLKPLFVQLQGAASKMFPYIQSSIQSLVKVFAPTLLNAISTTAVAIGKAFQFITDHFLATPLFRSEFKTLVSANAHGLGDMAKVIVSLLKAFTQLAVDAIPLANVFSDWLVKITGHFSDFISTGSKGGNDSPIVKFFKMAGDRAALLGDIIKQIVRVFFEWGRAAQDSGLGLLETFDRVTKRFADGLGSPEGQKKLHAFFAEVEPGFKAIASLVGALLGAFMSLATSPGLKIVADDLRNNLLPMLQHLLNYLNTNLVPKLIPIVDDIGRVITRIVDSGVLQTVASDLGAFIHVIASAANSPIFGLIVGNLGHLLAAVIAYKLIKKFSPFDEFFSGISLFRKGLTGTITDAERGKSVLGKLAGGFREVELASIGGAKNLSVGQKISTFVAGAGKPSVPTEALSDAEVAAEKAGGRLGPIEGIVSRLTGILPALGEAFSAISLPIAAVAAVVAAVVGSFIYAYKTSKTVRDNIAKIWEGLKQAFDAFIAPIEVVFKHVFVEIANAIGIKGKDISTVMHKLGDDVRKAWVIITGAIVKAMPVIKVVMGIIGKIIAETFKIAFAIIIPIIKIAVDIIKTLFPVIVDIVKVVFYTVRDIIVAVWTFIRDIVIPIIKFFWTVIKTEFQIGRDIITGVMDIIRDVVVGIWDLIKATVVPIVKLMWTLVKTEFTVAKAIITTIINAVRDVVVGAWNWVHDHVIGRVQDMWSTIKGAFSAAWHFLSGVVSNIKNALSGPFDWLKDHISGVVDDIVGFFTGLPSRIVSTISGIASAAGRLGASIWNSIKSGLLTAAKTVGDIGKAVFDSIGGLINKFAIDPINSTLHHKFHLPVIGSFTLVPSSVNIPTIPHLAAGGVVPATSGGLLALLGEAGKRERIEPLDSSGLSARDRAMIGTIVTQLTAGRQKTLPPVSIDVHPSPGMDEREVALQTSRELAWRLGA